MDETLQTARQDSQGTIPASQGGLTYRERQVQSPPGRRPDPQGLEEAIRHAKGEIRLKTTTLELPDSPPEVVDSASGPDTFGGLHPTV